jgi:epsilon-lactone hydrolase
MPSWQARIAAVVVRALLRRHDWGSGYALARRSRRLFGAPRAFQWFVVLGLRRELVRVGGVRGEWLVPPAARPGVILYLHGGGFVSCSAATHRPITAALARHAQRAVFSADYRLAPEHPFPAALDDVLAAYEWLLGTGVSASAIALAGDSAGGNLVFALALRLRDTGRPKPACIVAFSPWTDLASTGATVQANDGQDAMFHQENLFAFASTYLADALPDNPTASPAYGVVSDLPPILLHVGSTELLLDDARRLHAEVCRAGGTSHLAVYDDVPHCWQMFAPLVPEATESLRAAATFIGQHLNPEV